MTDPLTSPEDDPIEIILAFARQIEGARLQRDPMQIHDRDRWFVTLILALISDPHHHVGRVVGRIKEKQEWDALVTWAYHQAHDAMADDLARRLAEQHEGERLFV